MTPVPSARIRRLREKTEKEKLDGLMITELHNVFYLTGSWIEGIVLLTKEKEFLIVSPLFAEEARVELKGWEVVVHAGKPDEILKKVWRKRGKKLGFEASNLSYEEHERLSGIKDTELIPCRGWVEELRMIKDEAELARMQESTKVAHSAFEYVESKLKEGVSEKKISQEVGWFLRERSDGEAFPSIVLFGERTSFPHGGPSERKLKQNEVVLVDLGAKLQGYCSDLTRTFFFGEVPRKWNSILDLITQAQRLAIEEITPGVTCSKIDEMLKERMAKAGYIEAFLHRGGHGIGIEVHEAPFFNSDSQHVFREGMVVTVEPGVYLPGEGGIREEKMVVVTRGGNRVLE